jgi:hypothetical protein
VFTTNNVRKKEVTPNEIKKYIESLAESVKSWFYIYNPEYSAYQEEIKEYLQKLSRVGFGAFPPLLMAVFNKEKNNKKILDLLKSCERFSFLIFQVSKRQSNTKNSHYYRMAKNYYFNGLSLEDVIGDINWNIDGEDDDGEYYGEFDLEKFKSHITELYQKSEGFYSWSGIRYFLYEYELHLQEKAKGNQKISWQDYNKRKKEDTIEHIYPQSPNDDCWLNSFKKYNKKEKNKICHSLGNLLLLAHSKNSELQNFCFSHKVKHKNKDGDYSGYFNGSHSEIDVSGNKNWTAEEISFRGQRMLDFLEQRWDIDIEAWGVEKSELLNIPTTKNS